MTGAETAVSLASGKSESVTVHTPLLPVRFVKSIRNRKENENERF